MTMELSPEVPIGCWNTRSVCGWSAGPLTVVCAEIVDGTRCVDRTRTFQDVSPFGHVRTVLGLVRQSAELDEKLVLIPFDPPQFVE
jgi:hypothetical protein